MTSKDIGLLRLQNQGIHGYHTDDTQKVVENLAAMQAQDYYNALWALGLRTDKTEQQIVNTLEGRSVIRTWPQRGTLHFVSASQAPWQLALSSERQLRRAATRRKNLGLTDAILVQCQKIVSQALGGNNYLTRSQVLSMLESNGVATKDGRGYHILWHLSQTGVIYVGPMLAKQQTFGLLSELVPHPQHYTREESIARLARKYFVSHGPATIQDFMWWAGLTTADAKLGIAANEHSLAQVAIGDKIYWLSKGASLSDHADEAFLLPAFDEFLLGYKDRSDVLSDEHATKVSPGGNGMFFPMIVIRGQVVGTWKRTIKKDHVLLQLSPFERISDSDKVLLQKPIDAYGAFLGLPCKSGLLA